RLGEPGEGRREHRRGPGARGHTRLQIIDPYPERHPAVAVKQGQVPRLPSEPRPLYGLIGTLAHSRATPTTPAHSNQSCCACTPGGNSTRRTACTGGTPKRRRK